MAAIFNQPTFFHIKSQYTISEALDLEDATGIRFNWYNSDTGGKVSIGRTGGTNKFTPKKIRRKIKHH